MTSVWIAIGVYVWINHDPAVTYDNSKVFATRAGCEAIVTQQTARNNANPDIIGYGLKCIQLNVITKPENASAAPRPFVPNKRSPGSQIWEPQFHDAKFG